MTEYVISFGAWWGVVIILVMALNSLRFARVNIGWIAVAIGIHGLYFAANIIGLPFLDLNSLFGDLNWNWGGKFSTIAVSIVILLVLTIFVKGINFRAAGITFKQHLGSVVPAIIVMVAMIASVVALEIAAKDGRSLGLERLLFQATMPGLDEEIYFRGLLLLVLGYAVQSSGFNLLGARINWGGFLVTLLFGLGHSLFWGGGTIAFEVVAFAVTFYLGFGLLWIRERTGSILIPVIAHNLINFIGSFF